MDLTCFRTCTFCSIFFLSSSEDCDAVLVSVFICTLIDDVIHLQVFEKKCVREFTAVLMRLGKAILQGSWKI